MQIIKRRDYKHNPPYVGGPVSKALMQKRLARQAALERNMARYMRMECDHTTTLETQQLYGSWRPKRGLVFCEQCNKWRKIAKPPAPPEIPQTPLF